MKILITGITGNLGSRVVAKFFEKKKSIHEIYGLIRPESNVQGIQKFLDRIRLLICEESLFNHLCEIDFDIIIHCATEYGRTPQKGVILEEANINLPLNLLHSLNKNKKRLAFINADTYYRKYDEKSNHLISYRNSKKRFYECAKSYCRDYNISFFNMAIEHMYGPCEDNSKFVARLFNALNALSEFNLTNGEQLRDFIYIDDVVNAFYKVVTAFDENRLLGLMDFEVGTGKTTSLSNFSKIMRNQLQSSCILNFGALPYSDFELMESYAKIDSLSKIGWSPRYNCLSGIKAYIDERSRTSS